MWNYFLNREQLRKRALKNATSEIMRDFLAAQVPPDTARWDDVEIVALDFETTGLKPQIDQILSYGKVHIKDGVIKLSSARHELIRPDKPIPEASAIIHHITDDQAINGRPIAQVLPELLEYLSGKVMLVHYNKIEQGFLNAACEKHYGSPFMIPTIDTLVLARRILTHRNHTLPTNRLRLFNLQADFKLPRYKAHNALNDAISTAELFLALEALITPKDSTLLKDLIL
ncbi:MAG: 3'-5' exonuclease [Gammaproteobacteria bacterium]|nr:3'-5' exonuclease [Gammaproteobacteria bacterium]